MLNISNFYYVYLKSFILTVFRHKLNLVNSQHTFQTFILDRKPEFKRCFERFLIFGIANSINTQYTYNSKDIPQNHTNFLL